MKPALTKEEWDKRIADADWYTRNQQGHRAQAARHLYGQPFGFTREDVDALVTTVKYLWYELEEPHLINGCGDVLNSLAARIEALLPPESF